MAESTPPICASSWKSRKGSFLLTLHSLSHLVGFALKLRNLGLSDHGMIRELSTPLAGSLYGGEGHSRIYDDDVVYRYE